MTVTRISFKSLHCRLISSIINLWNPFLSLIWKFCFHFKCIARESEIGIFAILSIIEHIELLLVYVVSLLTFAFLYTDIQPKMSITSVAVISTLLCSGNWLKHISEESIKINVGTTITRLSFHLRCFLNCFISQGQHLQHNLSYDVGLKVHSWQFDMAAFLIVLLYCSRCREAKLFFQIGLIHY